MTWFVGGLNFQIEHHLFPRICHVHYPAISRLVEETCREFGIRYMVHRSFWAGMRSHFRWLRQMGMPDASAGGETTTAPGARDRSGSPAGVAAGCVEAGGRPMVVDSPGTPGAGTQISRLG
jgi:hypothetical protein